MNEVYSDYQNMLIAQQEYNDDLSVGVPVKIGSRTDKVTIGYVSEIEDTASGFQAYVVTDVKLPENPSQTDYDKVKHVTMLYRGSSGFNEFVEKPWDVTADWLANDALMALRILVPDMVPTRGTSQLRKAADFGNASLAKYGNATFSFYAHSLGSMGVQYTVTSLQEEYLDRVSGVYVYNGPNIYRTMDEEQRRKEEILHNRIFNYVDPLDIVGLGYNQKEGAVGQVILFNSQKSSEGLIGQHMWGGYDYDSNGNLIDKYGLVVDRQNYRAGVDIDGDGVEDIHLDPDKIDPRNLFLASGKLDQAGGQTIKVNPDSLRILSSNLRMLALTDIPAMIRVCQLCQEKNATIQGDFETRKQKVEESIVQRFKGTRLTEVFYRLHDSLGQLLNKKTIFEDLSSPRTLTNTFSDPAYIESGAYLELSAYNSMLSRLAENSRHMAQQLNDEKRGGFQNGSPINPTPTALKSSMVLEDTAVRLKKKSESIFEGTGLREGKTDGISQSITEVLEVEQKNLKELQTAVENVSRLTLSLANNFKAMDDWLQGQLSSGSSMEGFSVQHVPVSYQLYLEESAIFDDVKDVLQAFDQQVEERSNQYAKEVAVAFSEAFQQVQYSLERWTEQLLSYQHTVDAVQATFDIRIYVDKKEMVDDKARVTRTYWGQLVELYDSTTSAAILSAQQELPPLTDNVIGALEVIRSAKSDLQNLKPQIKAVIEEGVYTAFDLDEIVASHKIIQSYSSRIIQELDYVITTISSQMTGQAITSLSEQLRKVHQLTSYFNQMVGDCFGDQDGGETLPSGVLESKTYQFSLN